MITRRALGAAGGGAVAVALAAALDGCAGGAGAARRPPPAHPVTPPHAPVAPEAVPDAVPRAEPRARLGNPPFYDVFGKRYYVLSSSVGYVERGVASWYGPGFHEVRTSTGEPYDMYGMTAAHRTLPLPTYVRVTNLQNGRSCVVRVNDRGPFVGNRIIDLSYTAAAKLDMLRNGTAMVEVRAVDPGEPAPVLAAAGAQAASAHAAWFVQAGAFADPSNAERLAAQLRGRGYGNIQVRDDLIAGRRMYRVRIGPVADVAEFDRVAAALERTGIRDARLAPD